MDFEIASVFHERLSDLREFEACRIIHRYVRKQGMVLNAGCSWGRDTIFLSQKGLHVVSVDLDFWSQHYARGTIWPDSVQADATNLPFKDQVFSTVVMAECLEHIVEDREAVREAFRVLQPDGRFILTVPRVTGGKHDHVRGYSPEEAKGLLKSEGLEVKRVILRGGFITWANIIGPIIEKFRLQRCKEVILHLLSSLDFFLGFMLFPILNLSRYSGCYVISIKKEKGANP